MSVQESTVVANITLDPVSKSREESMIAGNEVWEEGAVTIFRKLLLFVVFL
jgi:hypothetical protein